MKKTTAKKTGSAKKVSTYTGTIQVLGRKYQSTGDSVKDVITNLEVKNGKGRGILVISNGSVTKERILMPMQVFRLFNTAGTSREIAIKNVSLLFDL